MNSKRKPIVQHPNKKGWNSRPARMFSAEAFGKVLIAVGNQHHLAGLHDISLSHASM